MSAAPPPVRVWNSAVASPPLQSHQLAKSLAVGGNPRRIAFSQLGHIGAVANLNGFVTFVR